MSKNKLTAVIDLDAMLHTVANVQFKAGNRDNREVTKGHISRFISTIKQNSKCSHSLMFYQKDGHTNFRNDILPEYKGHRVMSEAVATWKPTILEAFQEEGAFGLQHIESDDAVSITADVLGHKNVLVVTSDKDMLQVPCLIYNPYKTNITEEERWIISNFPTAYRFLWSQVLTGDSTDMPNNMCGIEGCGPAGAATLLDAAKDDDAYSKIIQKAYTKKYGIKEGFIRANRTYMMVRLLAKYGNTYINAEAEAEVNEIINNWAHKREPIKNQVADLFTKVKPVATLDLFFRK